jgi:hypothetical protein
MDFPWVARSLRTFTDPRLSNPHVAARKLDLR